MVGLIIGKSGKNINRLINTYKLEKIRGPRDLSFSDDQKQFDIIGPKSTAQKACEDIEKKVEKWKEINELKRLRAAQNALFLERLDAERTYCNFLAKALATQRGVEESELRAGDVGCVFGRRKLLREIMATIKGVDPDELSWDEVQKEFERKNSAGGEYGEGLDAENEELCEEVNKLRAELARSEEYPGEDEVYWTDYCSCDEYGYDSDSDW